MTQIETLSLAKDGSRTYNAYLARPPQTRTACVMVLHDMFGLNDSIRAVADRYAQAGYAAMVPNLFWRSEIPGAIAYDNAEHAKTWARLRALDLNVVSVDMATAVNWLRGQPFCSGKVAAVGFCGGGRFAYLAAARCGVDGAASLYGLGISEHLGELEAVRCPVQLHYGLRDEHIPKQEIDKISAGIAGCRNVKVFLYPEAGHSFANPVRPGFDPAATALANERVDDMLKAM